MSRKEEDQYFSSNVFYGFLFKCTNHHLLLLSCRSRVIILLFNYGVILPAHHTTRSHLEWIETEDRSLNLIPLPGTNSQVGWNEVLIIVRCEVTQSSIVLKWLPHRALHWIALLLKNVVNWTDRLYQIVILITCDHLWYQLRNERQSL